MISSCPATQAEAEVLHMIRLARPVRLAGHGVFLGRLVRGGSGWQAVCVATCWGSLSVMPGGRLSQLGVLGGKGLLRTSIASLLREVGTRVALQCIPEQGQFAG